MTNPEIILIFLIYSLYFGLLQRRGQSAMSGCGLWPDGTGVRVHLMAREKSSVTIPFYNHLIIPSIIISFA